MASVETEGRIGQLLIVRFDPQWVGKVTTEVFLIIIQNYV